MAIEAGTKAPDFTLKSKSSGDGADVTLSSNFGSKNTVLLFVPLAFTGVCTGEWCDITAGLGAYTDLNADVIGISVDSPKSATLHLSSLSTRQLRAARSRCTIRQPTR